MKRAFVLSTIVAIGALSMAVAGFQAPAGAPAHGRGEGRGQGEGRGRGPAGPPMLEIKKVKDTLGSNEFFGTTVEFIAQQNTKTNMEKMPNFKDDKSVFLPKKTFKDKLTLGKGADEIDVFYFGPAHTSGDAFVVFKQLRAMHAGDAFAGRNTPIIDTMNGGSAVGYGKTLAKAASSIKNVDTVIGGHTNDPMTFADLKQYADFNNDFVAWVQGEIKAGKSVDEAAAEYKVPDKYPGYTVGTFFGGIKGNIQTAYTELGKK